MKRVLLLLSLLMSASVFAESHAIESTKQTTSDKVNELDALYLQRDAIARGLSDLAYDVCFSSKLMRVSKVLERTGAGKKFDKKKDPLIVLPYEIERMKKGKKGAHLKDLYFSRLLSMQNDKDNKENEYFYKEFFHRHSCLNDDGIMYGCAALSDRGFQDSMAKKIRSAFKKKSKYLKRFSANRACRVYDAKSKYVKSLDEIQRHIALYKKEKYDPQRNINKDDDEDDFDDDDLGGGSEVQSCICHTAYQPVCAIKDGQTKTYSNACRAECEQATSIESGACSEREVTTMEQSTSSLSASSSSSSSAASSSSAPQLESSSSSSSAPAQESNHCAVTTSVEYKRSGSYKQLCKSGKMGSVTYELRRDVSTDCKGKKNYSRWILVMGAEAVKRKSRQLSPPNCLK